MQQTVPPSFIPPLPVPHEDRVMRGIVFALGAYFLFGLMQACAKILSEQHSVIEIAFYRNLIALVPLILYIISTGRYAILKTGKPKALLFRVMLGTIGLIVTFAAVKYLPMADATVIFFTGVLLTPAVAFFVLKEYIGPHRWAAIIIGLAGVILMVRPTGEAAMLGVIIAFTAASMHAVINVSLRYLKTESSLTVTFYFVLCGTVVPGLMMPFVAHTPGMDELWLFLAVGIAGGVAQYFLTSAFRMAPATLVAMFNYTGLIWATLFDIALWQDVPDITVFAGGAIIIASQAYIVHRERLAAATK